MRQIVTVNVETENAAFRPSVGLELARIFRKLADRLEAEHAESLSGLDLTKLLDENGNTVGYVGVREYPS